MTIHTASAWVGALFLATNVFAHTVALRLSLLAAGIVLAWYLYMSTPVRPETIGRARTPLHAFLLNAWYFDRLYDRLIVQPYFALCALLVGCGGGGGGVTSPSPRPGRPTTCSALQPRISSVIGFQSRMRPSPSSMTMPTRRVSRRGEADRSTSGCSARGSIPPRNGSAACTACW